MSAREVLQRLRREIAIDSDPLWALSWQQAVDRGSRQKKAWSAGIPADHSTPRLKDLLLAQEFKRIARCLCWLCMKGFPERWIIILRAVYPWGNFPHSHLVGESESATRN